MCFIWPASVLWGKKKTYAGVRFGLCYGSLVPAYEPYLQGGGRKQVYWRDMTAVSSSDERIIRSLIRAAIQVDHERSLGLK